LVILTFFEIDAFKKGDNGKYKKIEEEKRKKEEKAAEYRNQQVKVDVTYRPKKCEIKTRAGHHLSVHYVGILKESNQMFDSSRMRQQTFNFTLGSSMVIPGWEQGMTGMCIGEKRKVEVPPRFAYGIKGHPPYIPPDSTLIFDVELIALLDTLPPMEGGAPDVAQPEGGDVPEVPLTEQSEE